jgi:hypothetical protein
MRYARALEDVRVPPLHHELGAEPPAGSEPAPIYRCQSCRASYESGAWGALPIVAEVAPNEVRSMVEDWPSGLLVRVRRCACGQPMARKERAT